MASSEPICQALNLSDGKACTEPAVVWDELFCRFHGRQCHGLYAGYKKRNARLESLAEQAPDYLKSNTSPLANDTFESLDNENVLGQVHRHLFIEYVLLGKVIDARKLHHKHFYPRKMDYGHQAYLDSLSSRRYIVLRALERLEKRTAQVLYEKEKWFRWVRKVQKEEEDSREKEAKKIKLEAAMFKRHWKKMEARLRDQRKKEESRIQDAFLEAAYLERMNAAAENDAEAEMWDPIEDFVEDERGRYIDLIKHFLWLEVLSDEDENGHTQPSATQVKDLVKSDAGQKKKPKKKPKAKTSTNSRALTKSVSTAAYAALKALRTGQGNILDVLDNFKSRVKEADDDVEPDPDNIETEQEMRKRLKEGVTKNYNNIQGPYMLPSLEMPHGSHEKTAPLPDDEIDTLIEDIKEIKLLLFCRLLLRHASLLPAALRAANVNEFLSDSDITGTDLRDICLKVEKPCLQDIRDACADLTRADEPEVEEEEDDFFPETTMEDIILQRQNYGHLEDPDLFVFSMIAQQARDKGKSEPKMVRGRPESEDSKRMKVRICGKSIWNYSSESSMTRDGWLHFSVLAKDCDLKHAVQLCRNWDEFFQLNSLASWQYFPASNWLSWGANQMTKQLHDLGFFPFFTDLDAKSSSHHYQVGGGRSRQRRHHHFVEARNLIVGHMKRKDPVTRRFLQYCSMRTGEILMAVLDGRTDKVITAPKDKDALWTLRYKMGKGRATKNAWEIALEVGPEYFDGVDMYRNWYLGFDDFLEVWIWSLVPGQEGFSLYNVVAQELYNARRIRKPIDVYNHQESFLRSLTREPETLRVRSIKPGEQVKSLWDEVQHPDNIFVAADLSKGDVEYVQGAAYTKRLPHMFYNEANEVEDAVLFPDELTSPNSVVPYKELANSMTRFGMGGGTMAKYMANIAMNSIRDVESPEATDPEANDDDDYSDTDESIRTGESHDDSADDPSVRASLSASNAFDPDKAFTVEVFEDKDGTVTKHWRLPVLWEDVVNRVDLQQIDIETKLMLKKVGLLDGESGKFRQSLSDLEFATSLQDMDPHMILDKDRADAVLEASHAGDLEPGAPEKYKETCEIVNGILAMKDYNGSNAWIWVAVDILDWLDVKADATDYAESRSAPWPHPFITQDILRSWAHMAIFFPDLEQCEPANVFFASEEGQKYKDSLLRSPLERSKTTPDIRTSTSYKDRPKSFWRDWEDILEETREKLTTHAGIIPLDWSIVTRPIIAKLYLAGVISPVMIQNTRACVPGVAIANTEPHRLDKLDLFIYYGGHDFRTTLTDVVEPRDYPDLKALARAFAAEHKDARFALLRLWSAPHFYPTLHGAANCVNTAFLDSAARSWRWNFVPKDMPLSEWSVYNYLHGRLEPLAPQFGGRVHHRSEIVLVMGVDEEDLFRLAMAVTFAVQTKPWFREFDLWKSFVNVDLEFLEGLDAYWVDEFALECNEE